MYVRTLYKCKNTWAIVFEHIADQFKGYTEERFAKQSSDKGSELGILAAAGVTDIAVEVGTVADKVGTVVVGTDN